MKSPMIAHMQQDHVKIASRRFFRKNGKVIKEESQAMGLALSLVALVACIWYSLPQSVINFLTGGQP